jgi:hypothetical protein
METTRLGVILEAEPNTLIRLPSVALIACTLRLLALLEKALCIRR